MLVKECRVAQHQDLEKYKWYLERVSEKRKRTEKLSDSVDVAVITLASGALAISATFITISDRRFLFHEVSLLGVAWVAFVVAILFNILSIISATKSHFVEKKKLDMWLEDPDQDVPPKMENGWSIWTSIFNTVSLLALMCGLIFLPMFAWKNISDAQQSKSDRVEKTFPGLSDPLPPSQKPSENPPSPGETTSTSK